VIDGHDPLCLSQEVLPTDLPKFCDCERVRRIRNEEFLRPLGVRLTYEAELRKYIADQITAEADALYEEIQNTEYSGRGDDLIRADDIGQVVGMRIAAKIVLEG
jgi:hypothetical protein